MSEITFPFSTAPDPGEAIELASGILWICIPLPLPIGHVNVYALDDGDGGWSLIDTGMASGKSKILWQKLLDGPLKGRPINRLIVTHHHPDHMGLAGWFQSRGTALFTTRTAWLYARMLYLDEQKKPSPEDVLFYQRAGMPAEMIERRKNERPFNFCDMLAPMPRGFHNLVEGQKIHSAGKEWQVRIGGGHAPDHLSLWSSDDTIVIGGDLLLPSISANIGVYPIEPDANPLADWFETCERFKKYAKNEQLILPGHKLPYRGLPIRLEQMIENHDSALNRLEEFLKTPKTANECLTTLYGRRINHAEYGLAIIEAIAHLNYLLHMKQVSREISPQSGAWLWQCRV